jgi:CheY-like chemotaxis protein
VRDAAVRGIVHDFGDAMAALVGRAEVLVEVMLAEMRAGRLDPALLRNGLLLMREVTLDAAAQLEPLRGLIHSGAGALAAGETPRAAPAMSGGSACAARPALLVVEDDRVFGELLEELLSAEGWQVRGAPECASALEALAEETFQVVLIDLVLPGGDGWDIVRVARRHHPGSRVIVMSGAMGPEDVGADAPQVEAFLAKPIDLDRLLAVIGALSPGSSRG